MFAPSFGRVARSTSSIPAASAITFCRAGLSTAQKPFRPTHQRRYSSSKSSIPPSNKKKPAQEVEQNAATQLVDAETGVESKDKATKMPATTSTHNVPHVPPTTHDVKDVHLSSFFALHRPLAFHREAWQQPATMDVFNELFEPSSSGVGRAVEQTRRALDDFLQELHAKIDAAEEMQADSMFMQENTHHLDGPPTEDSIGFYASQMTPFQPPPPPIAFDPFAMNRLITEVELPTKRVARPTTFREHVHRRRGGMLLISVKRQRKLKMKKHKYKKLMKRTRLLRRKLDRT